MIIQINTDKYISDNARVEEYLNFKINEELSRFRHIITKIKVHLSDENGPKEGHTDKRCMLEVMQEKKDPIVVTTQSVNIENAVNDGLLKLKSILLHN